MKTNAERITAQKGTSPLAAKENQIGAHSFPYPNPIRLIRLIRLFFRGPVGAHKISPARLSNCDDVLNVFIVADLLSKFMKRIEPFLVVARH